MSHILMLLPNNDFDPTESAVPWHVLREAGHEVWFASEDGTQAACDPITLNGSGLTGALKTLAVRPENRALYTQMINDPHFRKPMAWHNVEPEEFAGLILPGGHAPGMRAYLESKYVQTICRNFFLRKAPIASICHGILVLARTQDIPNRSLLYGYKVTGLNNFQEKIAIKMTRKKMGDHYQTYPETVQDEVMRGLANPKDFEAGPVMPSFGTAKAPHKGFVVVDRHLVSARWPGDAYKLAHTFCGLLSEDAG
ncbi:MAG: hypothetical protein COA69_04590 [Robiginitomaculum sp.]|nr:MAG: hypothetical protein COA69_04590 [Robiginitomaculum sp.]